MGQISCGPVLEASFFESNRRRLRELFGGTAPVVITANGLLQRSGDTAFPFQQDSNFWYLTGLDEPGLVLVLDGGKEYLIIPERESRHITFDGAIDVDHIQKTSGINDVLVASEGWKRLTKRLKKVKHVATLEPPPPIIRSINLFTNPARADLIDQLRETNPDIAVLDLRQHFSRMRQVKSDPEIKAIEYAISHTNNVFKLIKRRLSSYQSERDIMADVLSYAAKNGLTFGYDPVIAGGSNSLTLHYIDNSAPLNQKEPVLLDIGLRFQGYTADISRTYCAQPTKRHKQVFTTVCEIQDFALGLLKPGTDLAKYEKEVEHFTGEKLRELGLLSAITKEKVRRFYPHSTSHFLGIDVHDLGDYSRPLEPGMVLTVEPGIYIAEEGFGVRLEEDILITKNGNKVLTKKLPKTLD